MSLLRTTNSPSSSRLPLRILATGTLFVTYTLIVSSCPEPGDVVRAQSVQKTRGGHGANVLVVLSQFRSNRAHSPPAFDGGTTRTVDDVQFCGPVAGSEEGGLILKELEAQGVAMLFSILRDGQGVPSAWVIEAADKTKTIINHNPLLDMTHDEFVSRLGPVLAPENYDMQTSPPPPNPTPIPNSVFTPNAHMRKRSGSGQVYGSPPNGHTPLLSPYSQFIIPGMPPFDWMHFEGRTPQTTLANITGLDGLARERGWRTRCIFSLEITRPGAGNLIPHADVVFFSKPYAQSLSPSTTPRSFLISMSAHAAPHALLVVDWGAQGAALLSVPTREYLQSSGWVEPPSNILNPMGLVVENGVFSSVRSGSGFWADGRPQSGVTVTGSETSQWTENGEALSPEGRSPVHEDSDSRRTSLETERGTDVKFVDEMGSHDAFVAGMIFSLSQKVLPGRPYIPGDVVRGPASGGGANVSPGGSGASSGRWTLVECLRFATELAGRKGRRMDFAGLRQEMETAGWMVE
ncbi:hypothetical protein K439DRAFT_1622064 [Ramaria rubella]|nr:hypothetical protein K439DRAFT_1622064 [Ramaria rubella]